MKKQSNGRKENIAIRKAVLFFGGPLKLSQELITDSSTVSKWLYEKRSIPIKHAIKIEQLSDGAITAKELRPDVFIEQKKDKSKCKN